MRFSLFTALSHYFCQSLSFCIFPCYVKISCRSPNCTTGGSFFYYPLSGVLSISFSANNRKRALETNYNSRSTGQVIGILRVQRGLSQEVLSGLAGIARSHLAMIELGMSLCELIQMVSVRRKERNQVKHKNEGLSS